MSTEQFTQVVDAILDGKYSWACVLILRFAGYNPLHYIPYRTYNRLMKENRQVRHHPLPHSEEPIQQMADLNFLESLEEDYSHIRGSYKTAYCSDRSTNLPNWQPNRIPIFYSIFNSSNRVVAEFQSSKEEAHDYRRFESSGNSF